VHAAGTVAVLHVAQPTSGGVAAYVSAAAADQLGRRWRIAVACPDGGRLAGSLAANGVPRLHWPASRAPGPGTLREISGLRDLVAAFRPDVVHLHSAKAGHTGRLAIRARVPTLFQPHGWSWLAANRPLADVARAWERAAAACWTDALVCVSEGEAELGRRGGVPGPFSVVRNGADLRRFRAGLLTREEARSLVGVAPRTPLAVCVGRVTRQKGQDLLLAAWPLVSARCPGAELAVVGAPGSGLPAVPGVRLVGEVDDVRPWYHAADVVVQPSRWEGLPLSALEALACGRPVVAANIPGLAEVVRPGVGALVRAGNPVALADGIARRLTDPALAHAEGCAAAGLARREFDERDCFARLAEITAGLAAGRGQTMSCA